VLPTTLVSILRGSSTNTFGDTIDTPTVVASAVPMSILEQSRATTKRASDRAQTVLSFLGRCSPSVDVRQGDRLLDTAGSTYVVHAVSRESNPIAPQDQRLDLERVQLA